MIDSSCRIYWSWHDTEIYTLVSLALLNIMTGGRKTSVCFFKRWLDGVCAAAADVLFSISLGPEDQNRAPAGPLNTPSSGSITARTTEMSHMCDGLLYHTQILQIHLAYCKRAWKCTGVNVMSCIWTIHHTHTFSSEPTSCVIWWFKVLDTDMMRKKIKMKSFTEHKEE